MSKTGVNDMAETKRKIKNDSASDIIKQNIRRKRKSAAIVRNTAITVVCIALGVIISIQYKSIKAESSAAGSETDRLEAFQAQYMKLEQENESLKTANEEFKKKVELLESATNDEQIANLEKELAKIQMFAGTTAVKGDALRINITLTDDMLPATLQRHLLTLINELKACSAQAIAINGERITAMTEIRAVGQYVVINGRQHQSPFEIYAIGRPQDMLNGVLLSGSGPLANIMKEKACEASYATVHNAVINACEAHDIATDLLKTSK